MSIGTDRLQRMINGTHEPAPCGVAMSLPQVSEFKAGYVRCMHIADKRYTNSNGVIFGGYISALLDDVSGHTAMTLLPDDKVCATSELAVSYFRPCLPDGGELVIEGTVINQSRRSYHIEVTLKRADGKLVAKGHAIHALSDRQ